MNRHCSAPAAAARLIGRFKDFRRISTRYDKDATNFLTVLCLAALICC
jgi:transposase